MNPLSTFGIFVVVFFAYNTPTQGETFTVDEVVFDDGQRCITNAEQGRYLSLTKILGFAYEIKETVKGIQQERLLAKVSIMDFHTMILNTVVFGTDRDSFQIKLHSLGEAQQLFDITTADILQWRKHLYDVTAVYKYDEGRILEKVLFSGHTISVSETLNRYMIHTGGPEKYLTPTPIPPYKPFLLWTSNGFNYCDYDERSILLTFFKSVDRTNDYFLVKFDKAFDLNEWKENHGKNKSDNIPKANADPKILSYFDRVYVRTD